MKRLGRTPPFRGTLGQPAPGSIAEIKYLRLGGVDQWVMFRGENVANPALVFLHGGPGLSEMRLFRHFNAPLEKIFTVVHWDQRGTGKSFDPKLPKSSMTVEQFLADLDQLVDEVRRRLGKEKVVVLGHSWGSALGALYASRFPEKVSVYVGAAQVADSVAQESASYARVLAKAQQLDNQKALKELRAIGPPPYSAKALWTERMWTQRLDGQLGARVMWHMGRVFLGGGETSILDLPNVMRGFRWTLDVMYAEVSKLNLFELVPALQMPVFFFVGRHDPWIPPETSVAYFDALRAPSKKLVWFDRSGHELFADEPEKFNSVMTELVLAAL